MNLVGMSADICYRVLMDYEKGQEIKWYYIKDMYILETLNKLGFPIDQIGTYLYKDIISEIMYRIDNDTEILDNEEKKNKLLSELNNVSKTSQFYTLVALEYNELPIKRFKDAIDESISKIENKDEETEIAIFGINNGLSFGEQAYMIATYVKDEYQDELGKIKKIKEKQEKAKRDEEKKLVYACEW